MLPAPSVRRRLFAVAVFALVACLVAGYAIFHLARTTDEQRSADAREIVVHEVEHLAQMVERDPTLKQRAHGVRGVGLIRSGFLDARLHDRGPSPGFAAALTKARADAARESVATGAVVVRKSRRYDGTPVVLAALALPQGGYAWAAMNLPPWPHGLRTSVVVLALATLTLVLVALHTLFVFQRGITSIRGSLVALGRDRAASVEYPKLSELDEIAHGIETLARELAHKERLAALGSVVAGVAHEVRNPLTAMKLRVDLALSAPRDPALTRDFTIIADEIARLERFVSNLLTAAGQKIGAPSRVSLGDLARSRVALVEAWARGRGVRIDVEGDVEASVDVDAITRLIDNLLRNAVEASPQGGVVVVDLAQAEGARLSVVDAGQGIPEERVPRIFEPFFTTKRRGTGLGLAVSHAIAVAHGGTLAYARADGRTRFTLTLPRVLSTEETRE